MSKVIRASSSVFVFTNTSLWALLCLHLDMAGAITRIRIEFPCFCYYAALCPMLMQKLLFVCCSFARYLLG